MEYFFIRGYTLQNIYIKIIHKCLLRLDFPNFKNYGLNKTEETKWTVRQQLNLKIACSKYGIHQKTVLDENICIDLNECFVWDNPQQDCIFSITTVF